jgi:hypothetical protein
MINYINENIFNLTFLLSSYEELKNITSDEHIINNISILENNSSVFF